MNRKGRKKASENMGWYLNVFVFSTEIRNKLKLSSLLVKIVAEKKRISHKYLEVGTPINKGSGRVQT